MKCDNGIAEIGGGKKILFYFGNAIATFYFFFFFFLRNDMFTQFLQYCENVVKILWT